MPPWSPGDPWPSDTPGGAAPDAWGGYIRLWLRAALQAGNPWHMGPHTFARLDSGNVMSGTEVAAVAASPLFAAREASVDSRLSDESPAQQSTPISRLWVDLTCDLTELQIAGGIQSTQGIFSRPDAYTLVAKLFDPEGIYDPVNPKPPWTFGGVSRLIPGTPVECFVEVVDPADGSWERVLLFTGTADSWGEEWVLHKEDRFAELIATDITKEWVNLSRPSQPAAGLGDTTAARIARIVAFYGWDGVIEAGASGTTHASTNLDASGWENLNKTMDDELGVVHFTPEGTLRWMGRNVWLLPAPPVINIGCPPDDEPEPFHDIVLDADPSKQDAQMRNSIYASREGGVVQHAVSPSSITRHGAYEYTRTDLGVETDPQAGAWANTVLQVNAYPRQALEHVTLRPDLAPNSWDAWLDVLSVQFFSDLARVVWEPVDDPTRVVDTVARVVGTTHAITFSEWTVEWALIGADALTGTIFTMGPHPQDRLDNANVMG